MTLDAAKWNGTGGELSSCVINTSIRSCILIFGTLSEQIYQMTFYPFFVLCTMHVYVYICVRVWVWVHVFMCHKCLVSL